jgi:hypothetical protein
MTATSKEETGSQQIQREVPIGATTAIRAVCKESLQSLVTTLTNMELEVKVIGSPEGQRQESIVKKWDYWWRTKRKMKGKRQEKLPFITKKCETELKWYYFKKERKIRGAQSKDICDRKGAMHPEYEEQSGEPTGIRFDRSKWWCHQIIEWLRRAEVQNARSVIWILDDMPDSEENPHNETAGQQAISWILQKVHIVCWCCRIPIGNP